MKAHYTKVLMQLESDKIEAIVSFKKDQPLEIVARDNKDLPFSTWFDIDGDEMVSFDKDDDFFA